MLNRSQGPLNTFGSRPTVANTLISTSVPLATGPKQITRSETEDSTTSRYFPSGDLATGEIRQDVVMEGTQETLPEIQGIFNSSTLSNVLSPHSMGHTETTSPSMRKRRRRRRDWSQPRSQGSSPVTHRHHSVALRSDLSSERAFSYSSESPDVLAFGNNPPANVRSDIIQQQPKKKRNGSPFLINSNAPPVKRPKPPASKEPIELSEDELQVEASNRTSSASKRTNPSGISQSPARSCRGDMKHTNFKNLPTKSEGLGLPLVRAVCDKDTYTYNKDNGNQISLYQSHDKEELEPRNQNGQIEPGMSWLKIDLKQVRKIHLTTNSPDTKVVILRSKTTQAGARLVLDFDDPNSIEMLSNMLGSHTAQDEMLPYVSWVWVAGSSKLTFSRRGYLEKVISKAFSDASNYSSLIGATEQALARESVEDERSHASIPTTLTEVNDKGGRAKTKSKLKDKLLPLTSAQALPSNTTSFMDCRAPDTRRTRRSSPGSKVVEKSPTRWTDFNPGWRDDWERSLVFPATGRNRTTVDQGDIPRLNEGEFLNDNLISFYLRFLQSRLEAERPELLEKVYIFSTFFFEKLKSTKGKINYEGVRTWTAKVDLLSYDYIVVPVNEHAHWYLAIICNAPKTISSGRDVIGAANTVDEDELLEISSALTPKTLTVERGMSEVCLEDTVMSQHQVEENEAQKKASHSILSSPALAKKASGLSPQKPSSSQPKIITLDSLGSAHPPTCRALKEYLIQEAKAKRGLDLAVLPSGMTAKGIPEQDNFCDCGVFVLGYMEEFLKDPDEAARKLLLKEALDWDIRPSQLRHRIRSLLFDLQVEQQARLLDEKSKRRNKKKATEQLHSQTSSLPATPRQPSSPALKMPGAFPTTSPIERTRAEQAMSSSSTVAGSLTKEANKEHIVTKVVDEPQKLRPETHCVSEEPVLISCLPDLDSIDGPSTANRNYFSEPPSIKGRTKTSSARLVVELHSRKAAIHNTSRSRAGQDVVFVTELPNSASECHSEDEIAEKTRQLSEEIDGASQDTVKPPIQQSGLRPPTSETISSYFSSRAIPSVEADDIVDS